MDNKTLTELLSKNLDISIDSVNSLINSLAEVVGERCSELDTISIPSFGSFEPRKRNERVSLHPASGKRLLVPPKISIYFKPSLILRQKIRDGK